MRLFVEEQIVCSQSSNSSLILINKLKMNSHSTQA